MIRREPRLIVYHKGEDSCTVYGKELCDYLAKRMADLRKQGVTKPVIILNEPLWLGMKAWIQDKLEEIEISIKDTKDLHDPLTGTSFNGRPIIVTFLGLYCPQII